MCGINGFTFADPKTILAMNQATCHRGPDATAVWEGQGITFGHNRLAIIDLSPRGAQPMWDADQEIVIVFNGEIYNFKELRADLEKKYTFQSASDTEVILYAYKEYGRECVKKLNGIFGFAIWDTRTQELFLVRDRMGVNPLYYTVTDQGLIFSSEIKAILEHKVKREVDLQAFNLYFSLLYTPEPLTMFKGIWKLPAASYLVWKKGKYTVTKYWEVTDFSNQSNQRKTTEEIKKLFDDSIEHQLIADRAVGIFLSGGIDSTAVLGAVVKKHPGKIKTFSVGFKDSLDPAKFNADFSLAEQTAKFYNTDHHKLMIGAADIRDNLPNIVWHLDEPNSNPTAGAMFLLAQMAKKDVAVVLGGDGGDELFGGYPRYYYSRLISVFKHLPKILQKIIITISPENVASKLTIKSGPEQVLTFLAQSKKTVQTVLNKNIFKEFAAKEYLESNFTQDVPDSNDFEKKFMNIDRQSWLVDESLLRTNKMCLAFGLEARVPILDYRLVELSAKIPTVWKFSLFKNRPSQFQGKDIWREAIQDYLPKHVLNQQKRGWFTPMAKWLRQSELRDYVTDILAPGRLKAQYFDVPAVQTMWLNHLESKEYNLSMIWAIVMWQLWYETFIDQK